MVFRRRSPCPHSQTYILITTSCSYSILRHLIPTLCHKVTYCMLLYHNVTYLANHVSACLGWQWKPHVQMRIVHWHIWLPEGNRLQETCCRKKQLCLPCLKYLYLYCSCRLSLHQILIKRFLDQNFDYTRRNINKNYPWSIMHHHWLVVYLPLWKIWKSVGMIIPNIWKNKKMFQTTN